MRVWTGLSSLSSRVWYDTRTGIAYSANDDANHSSAVLKNLSLFGLTPEKLAMYGIEQVPANVHDYYGPLLYAAMTEGWVRMRVDARDPDNQSSAESYNLRAIRKAVIWYTENVGMPRKFIISVRTGVGDHEGNGYILDADQMEFFIQKGTIARELLKNSATHPMRQLINVVNETVLDEAGAGPSRIVSHIHDGDPFFTISAMRGEYDHKTNMKRSNDLRKKLNAMPVSVIEIEGEYDETRADGSKHRQPEYSFFVMPRKSISTTALPVFEKIGLLLAAKYEQESIGFGDGQHIFFIRMDGSREDGGDAVTFDEAKIADLFGFSRIKNRKFSFTSLDKHPGAVAYNPAKSPVAPRPKRPRLP